MKYDLILLSIAELNYFNSLLPRNPIIVKLHKLVSSDEELARLLAQQLFSNAIVGAGLADDSRALLSQMNELLTKVLEKY